jgi:hypothetical protein
MAMHDQERRTPRDYMTDAQDRYRESSSGSKATGIVIGLALVGFIVYLLFAAANPRTTGEAIRQTPPTPQTTTAPRTTTSPTDTTTPSSTSK